MLKRTMGAALLAAVALAPAAGAQASKTFRARLSPVPLDAAMVPNVTGSGTVTAALSGRKLSITGSYEGLQTAATIARVHKGVKTGVRGEPLFDLKVSGGIAGSITGAAELTPAQVADLEQGRLYVQVHSEKAPEGNLWGWLLSRENTR